MNFRDGVCVLAPHPDDETMGCGQLIARIAQTGWECKVIVISDGAGAHHRCCDMPETALATARKASCRKAMTALGLSEEKLVFLAFPDGKLYLHKDEIFARVKAELGDFHGTILVPHEQEGWSDHVTVEQIGKRLATQTGCRLLSYCVWFYYSMPFRKFREVRWDQARIAANSEALTKKRTALAIYQNDKAPCEKPYAGVLPKLLWHAVNDEHEVYFEE